MSITAPSTAEVALALFTTRLVSRSRYQRFVDGIGLHGDESVLDFGAGWGENTRYLAQRLDQGGRVTALDVSKEWQEVAKRRLQGHHNVSYANADIRHAGLKYGSFDIIIISDVLHDIPLRERAPIVKELAKKLAPDGFIQLRELAGKRHGMAVEEIRSLMAANGLKESSPQVGRNRFSARYGR